MPARVACSVLVAFAAACSTTRPPASGPSAVPAPAAVPLGFALPDLRGREVTAASLRGRAVLLDVWATWCVPCRLSLPFYQELAREYGATGLAVVAVSVDSERAAVEDFVREHALTFTVLHDPRGTLAERLELPAMPTLLLLDREGRVRWIHAGFAEADKPVIEEQVRELVATTR